jgi:hypothetical protein
VGTTPEALTLEQAFGPKSPQEKYVVGKKEIQEMYAKLNTTDSDEVDMVCFGCPHLSIPEMQELVALLDGKKIIDGKRLFVGLGENMYDMAKKMNLIEPIEKAGATVLTGVCNGPLTPWDYMLDRPKVVATNSGKAAHYIYAGSGMKVNVRYGSTKDCVNSLITGKFVDTGRFAI